MKDEFQGVRFKAATRLQRNLVITVMFRRFYIRRIREQLQLEKR